MLDISDITAKGDKMEDMMDMDPDKKAMIKEKLYSMCEEIEDMGYDPTQVIMAMLSGPKEMEKYEKDEDMPSPDKSAKIKLIIAKMKKGGKGMMEDEMDDEEA